MEIIDYIGTADGYVHHILVPSMGIPFILWLFLVGGGISLIYLILKKIVG